MDLSSPDMKAIAEAAGLLHQGDKVGARTRLLALWDDHADGTSVQRCTIAHFLADTEDDAAAELEWDLRALEAATGSREAEDLDPLSPDLASFLPSLQGSVGNGYRRLGDLERARRHVGFAVARLGALGDDPYGQMVRGVVQRLQAAVG